MGFAHGWFRMILGRIESDSHVLFWDFEDFLEEISKKGKLENLGIIGLLRRSVGNPRCGVDLRQGVDLCQGVKYPRRGKAEVPKWHPSGTPRRSIATPRCSYYSPRAIFGFLFPNTSYSYTDSLRT